jgi:hypothetical protein
VKRHPLSRRLARAFAPSPRAPAIAALVERRLRALADVAAGRSLHPRRREALRRSHLVQRALRRVEGSWHDGDANAVRDLVGAWGDGSLRTDPERARRFLSAADALTAAEAPEATLLCLLFELESALG